MEFSSKHFNLEKVSQNIFAAIAKEGGGAVANAGFVNLGEKTIIFDTFNTQQASEDLKHIAEKQMNQPVTWVINSHLHGDHIRGNQSFKESIIISSETTYSKMKEIHPARITKQRNDIEGLSNYIISLKNQLKSNYDTKLKDQISFLSEMEKSLPTLELVLPNLTFKDELTFLGTKRSAKLFSLGGGHSFCDSILYIPEEKVMFMGDLLYVNCHPAFFEESNPKKWIAILNQFEKLDFEVAVPGHGSVGIKSDLSVLKNYLIEVTNLIIKGDKIEGIEIPSRYKNWNSSENYHQNLRMLKESLK